MNITVYSHGLLTESARGWDVPQDFAGPMLNYLVYGYEPGSCFTAVLANDFAGAIGHSHPRNTIEAFKALVGWIHACFPREAHGSLTQVSHWLLLTTAERRAILERCHLIYTEEEEIMITLKDDRVREPVLY